MLSIDSRPSWTSPALLLQGLGDGSDGIVNLGDSGLDLPDEAVTQFIHRSRRLGLLGLVQVRLPGRMTTLLIRNAAFPGLPQGLTEPGQE